MELFETTQSPLAERLRPSTLDEVVGQEHLLDSGASFREMLSQGYINSFILWGPPGCGKTTIARLLALQEGLVFKPISAVFSGVADLRKIFEQAKEQRRQGKQTLLFVDEIHRFNRAQQDSFLPYVEDGTLLLVGATTENPSFELNAALLSRMQVYVLKSLKPSAMARLLRRAEEKMERPLPLSLEARELLCQMSDGDGRYFLGLVERLFQFDDSPASKKEGEIDEKKLLSILQKRAPLYDKGQDSHYNLISALHKSLRGSDASAALYWFCRMLEGGEDPNYIARRLLRFAAEDIGLADPQAMTHALAAWQSYERLGSPEGEVSLANSVLYLATAPKSNAAYKAYNQGRAFVKETGSLSPPHSVLNAPTNLMKSLGYGKEYIYDHDVDDAFSGQSFLPEEIRRPEFYDPVERGFEREIRKRLDYWARLRARKSTENNEKKTEGK